MITPAYAPTATERVLPRMALDFTTGVLDSRVTIARALNTATRVNSSGFIELVNADLPRFDYDPVTLAAKGLLIEEQRVNLQTYSDQFDNPAWVKTGVTISANSIISPDGTSNADSIIENALSGQHQIYQSRTLTAAPYTWTVYAKQGEGSKRWLNLYPQGSGVNAAAIFDLTLGTVTFFGLGQYLSSSITNAGNGWYRCSISFTGAAVNVFCVAYLSNASNAIGPTYTGNGTSSILLWGAQVEAGAFATSYIPTVASQVTRNADQVTMTGTNFSSWYNSTQGTFTAQIRTDVPTTVNGNQFILSASDNTANNRINIFRSLVGNNLSARLTSGGVSANPGFIGVIPSGSVVTCGIAANIGSNQVISAGGSTLATAATTVSMPTVNQLGIGVSDTLNSSYLNGWIQKLSYYSQRLTNAEMQAFTK